ncbi:MAG: recombinase family protein [Longimicrobiales bacterium]
MNRKRYLRTAAADDAVESEAEQNAACTRKWGPLENEADLYVDISSGATFNRPSFQRLLTDCLANPQSGDLPGRLEVHDPTRFGRPLADGAPDTRAFMDALAQFERAGWRVEFVKPEPLADGLASAIQVVLHAFGAAAHSREAARKSSMLKHSRRSGHVANTSWGTGGTA